MKSFTSLFLIFVTSVLMAQKNATVTFEKWISLKNAGSPLISPDGRIVIYTVTTTDWVNNTYDTEIWMSRDGGAPLQLTRTPKSASTAPRISPDSRLVSFLADRGEKNQLYMVDVKGGEAFQVTRDEDGIASYEWSPDGTQIAYLKSEPETRKDKTIKDRFGSFAIEGEEYRQSQLWLLHFNYDSILLAGQVPCYGFNKDSTAKDSVKMKGQECVTLPSASKLTDGNFTITRFLWNPDGRTIGYVKQPDPLINSSLHAAIVVVDVISKKTTLVVDNPTGDFLGSWAPDGKSFIYSTNGSDSLSNFYTNPHFYIYDVGTRKQREVLQLPDENKNLLEWNDRGIFFSAFNKMKQVVYRLDPQTEKIVPLALEPDLAASVSFSKNTNLMAVAGRKYTGLNEIFVGPYSGALKQITASSEQIKGWNTPVNEIIQWKSSDGTTIEGVLLKPSHFDPNKKYPLLVVIHGGPTGIDLPDPVPTYVYPIMQWVEKGALVLRVNYRGSAGYGEKFRSLNVRNLGIGDMWDVLSGVDYLDSRHMIDTSRMGCMGWSQGGYISAFLTTNTNRFKAISVGAGISDWVTYYVNTDITPFTRQYLQSTPWNDMDIYQKTSPMTHINQASTPTLIQHGELDKRVPIPNAYELYRGLQDRGIPSRLIVYKGFGHGINKPKERLAAVWHNWQWFNKYIFGEKEEPMVTDQ